MKNLIYTPSIRNVMISTLLFVLAMLFFLPWMNDVTIHLSGLDVFPDSDFFYTASELKEMSSVYDNQAATGYFITRFTLDIIWPIIYFLFLTTTTVYLAKKINKSNLRKLIVLLPLVAVIFDLIENTLCSLYFLGASNYFIALLASLSSSIKWILIFIAFINIIILILIHVIKKITRN